MRKHEGQKSVRGHSKCLKEIHVNQEFYISDKQSFKDEEEIKTVSGK